MGAACPQGRPRDSAEGVHVQLPGMGDALHCLLALALPNDIEIERETQCVCMIMCTSI